MLYRAGPSSCGGPTERISSSLDLLLQPITGVVPNSHKAGTTFYDIPFSWWKKIIETD